MKACYKLQFAWLYLVFFLAVSSCSEKTKTISISGSQPPNIGHINSKQMYSIQDSSLLNYIYKREYSIHTEEEIAKSREILSKIILDLNETMKVSPLNSEIIDCVNQVLFDKYQFKCSEECDSMTENIEFSEGYGSMQLELVDSGHSLVSTILNHKGNCISLSLVYLCIGDVFNIPIFGVNAPQHFFLRFNHDGVKRNIETTANGKQFQDSEYVEKFYIDREDIEKGLYLKELDSEKLRAFILLNCSMCHLDMKQNDKFLETIAEVQHIDSGLIPANLAVAIFRLLHGDYTKAIQSIDEVLKSDSNRFLALQMKAAIMDKTGRDNEAIENLQKVLQKQDSNYFSLLSIGRILISMGNPGGARPYIEKAAVQYELNAEVQYMLGYVRWVDDSNKAKLNFKKSIELDSNNASAYYNYAVCLAKDEEYEDSYFNLAKSIEIDGNNIKSHRLHAVVSIKLRRYSDALDSIDKVIENGGSESDYILKGYAQYLSSKYQLAKETFKELFLFKNIPIEARYYYSLILLGENNIDEMSNQVDMAEKHGGLGPRIHLLKAIRNEKKAIESEVDIKLYINSIRYEELALEYSDINKTLEMSNLEEFTIRLLTEAIRVWEKPDLIYSRGRMYDKLGMKKQAIEDYRIYLKHYLHDENISKTKMYQDIFNRFKYLQERKD